MIHNRFPELGDARDAFLGPDSKTQKIKQSHANELVQFSDVVQKLAKEEEPFRKLEFTNSSTMQSENPRNNIRSQGKAERDQGKKQAAIGLYARGKARVPEEVKLGDQTMTSALKNKYIVRSRHSQLTGGQDPFNPWKSAFVPNNAIQARTEARGEPFMHDRGPNVRQS